MEKRVLKHILIASSLSLITVVGVLVGFFRAENKKTTSLSDWMKDVDDGTSLKTMTIPGSHDSGALYSLADVSGQCQDSSFEEQLLMGIRFFDVRLNEKNGALTVYHGPINEGSSFEGILKTFVSFLDAHPSECLFLSVKKEDEIASTTFDTTLIASFLNYQTYFSTGRKLPANLGLARKKIILISRYQNNSVGLEAYSGWLNPDDAATPNTFDLPNASEKIHVQDHYRLKDNETKWSEITSALEYAQQNPLALTLNFFSGYLVKGFPPSYSLSTAKVINPKVLSSLPASPKGVLILDFVSKELVSKLLGVNL